jgi:hypothetical protein
MSGEAKALTVALVRARVRKISEMVWDDERAHGEEDSLYHDVLTAIANGAQDGPRMATEALKTKAIDFQRWCA